MPWPSCRSGTELLVRDLLVAGGGPVGLAVALHAARAGLDVAVHEPRPTPVDKACGEGLMPGAVSELDDLGVHPTGRPIEGIDYRDAVDDATHAYAPFRAGPGLGVRRTALQAELAEAVRVAGVPVVQRAVRDVVQRSDHVLVDEEPVRYLVAADGLHSPIRRLLDLEGRAATRRRFGLRCHVQQAPWSSSVEVHWAADAEAYVTPVAEDQVGVAVLTDSGASFTDVLASFPLLQARLTGERTKVRGAGPLRQRARRRGAGRVLLVGDAAGYVDALTGEGLAIGLAQARVAAAAVRAQRPDDYFRRARWMGLRHELLTHALLEASAMPPVRRHLVSMASRAPWVFSSAVDQLARPIARAS